jgi:hypothetical protein
MKIANATLQLQSNHTSQQNHEISESLRAWVGDRRPNFEGREPARVTTRPQAAQVQLSDAGKSAQSSEADAIAQSVEAVENDPKLRLIRAMIAMLTGREVLVFDTSKLNSSAPPVDIEAPAQLENTRQAEIQSAGYGIEYEHHESYTESEQTQFEASGIITTADGRELSFSLSLSMTRSYHEESDASIRLGDARKKQDPLVLNFNGNASQLTNQRFRFDLDSDGTAENINFVTGGSGFLALDRNGDNRINDGTELFGAHSGDGFAELAALDADHNGWIDENDAAYDQLRLWRKDNDGNDTLTTLRQADVGALSLGRVETLFDLKDSTNALQGQIRSSGVFLRDDGKAGTIQQIDLTV